MDKMIVVGRIGSPYGIRGWAKLFSYTQPSKNILQYKQWFIQDSDGWQLVDMENLQIQADDEWHMRIKLPDCESPEAVRAYTNLLIAVSKDQLPVLSEGDYYWSDLEGLMVVNTEGKLLGKVDHLFATGANDVLVVRSDRERLLPYIGNVILKVDLEKGQILVDWDADF